MIYPLLELTRINHISCKWAHIDIGEWTGLIFQNPNVLHMLNGLFNCLVLLFVSSLCVRGNKRLGMPLRKALCFCLCRVVIT